MSQTPNKTPPKNDSSSPRGKGGAKPGNQNSIRHGLLAGQLPKDAKYIEYRLNAFRRSLEQAVLDLRGKVTLPEAGCIQTALRWERHAALALRWLNKAGDTLKPADKLSFSREIARASAERDKAIAALGLDVKPAPWLIEADSTPANGDASDD